MKSGKRTKCGSNNVLVRAGKGLHIRGGACGVWLLAEQAFKPATHVCADCGFVELYADEKSDDRKQKGRFKVFSRDNEWQRPVV